MSSESHSLHQDITAIRLTGDRRNVGKTTLAVRLINALVTRGWRVAAIKHSHHALPTDRSGSDSDVLARAGATTTLYVGADGVIERMPSPQPELSELLARLQGYEIAIVEGYRDETIGARLHLEGEPPSNVRVFESDGTELETTSADDIDGLVARIEGWIDAALT